MLKDDGQRIVETLQAMEGIQFVTTMRPSTFDTLPCVLVTLAGERGIDWRDGEEFLTEVEYLIRVFTSSEEEMRTVCAAVFDTMIELGYTRVLRWEEDEMGMRQTAFRFKRTW